MASTSISSDISYVFLGEKNQVLPAPGGDLIRDGAAVLPTGRRWPNEASDFKKKILMF